VPEACLSFCSERILHVMLITAISESPTVIHEQKTVKT